MDEDNNVAVTTLHSDEQATGCIVPYGTHNTYKEDLQSYINACTEKFFNKQEELIRDIVKLENDGVLNMKSDMFETLIQRAVRVADSRTGSKSFIQSGSAVYMSRWGTLRPEVVSEVLKEMYGIGPRVLKKQQQAPGPNNDANTVGYIDLAASNGCKGIFTPIIYGRVMEGKFQSWLSVEFHEDDKSRQLMTSYSALIQSYYHFIINCMLKISAVLRFILEKPSVTYADYISHIGNFIDPLRFSIGSRSNTFIQIVMDFISFISSSPHFEKLFNMMRCPQQIQQFVSITRNHTIFTTSKTGDIVEVNNTNVKKRMAMFPIHWSIVKLFVDGQIKVIHYTRVGCTSELLKNMNMVIDRMERKCNENVFAFGDDENDDSDIEDDFNQLKNKRKKSKYNAEKTECDGPNSSVKKKNIIATNGSVSASSSTSASRRGHDSVYIPSDDSDVGEHGTQSRIEDPFSCFDPGN